jgi:AraC family transcriptional regulator, transcriptional activator of pobA
MQTGKALTLINPRNGNLAFKIFSFEDNNHFDHIQRNNYYSIILVLSGSGKLKADFSAYNFNEATIMCFAPYQPFMISAAENLNGIVLNFHPDFFCIHQHQKEVACNGVLFNNIYQSPCIPLVQKDIDSLSGIIEQLRAGMQDTELAQYELLISYLKIFLITASRLRVSQNPNAGSEVAVPKEPFVLQNLKDAIEKNFKTKHSRLNMPVF